MQNRASCLTIQCGLLTNIVKSRSTNSLSTNSPLEPIFKNKLEISLKLFRLMRPSGYLDKNPVHKHCNCSLEYFLPGKASELDANAIIN